MTQESQGFHFGQPHRPRPKRDWRRAIRALRELVRNPDRTELAAEIFDAVDSEIHERALARMLEHPVGRKIYSERPCLRSALADHEALARMPEASLAHAYLEHLERHGLDPAKLVEIGSQARTARAVDADVRWMRERSELTHDLWHVLTGYGADQLGEATLLLFSLAQAGGRANAILALGANLRVARMRGLRWIPYAWTAWRRGRRAVCLQAVPYEKLLPLPLDEVRAAVGIDAPEQAHPGGVVHGDPIRAVA